MLRIGICDDLADARLVLRSLLERILEARKVQGQFFEFSSAPYGEMCFSAKKALLWYWVRK